MSDCSSQSVSCSIISMKFGDDVMAFGVYNFVQSLSACIGMVLSIVFKNVNLAYYLALVCGLQVCIAASLLWISTDKVKELKVK